MKNKIVFIGSLCAILALGLVFAGCDEEAQLVKLEYSKLSSPGNVAAKVVTITVSEWDYSANDYVDVQYKAVDVTWDAVSDATSYNIVATQEGKKAIYSVATYTGNPVYSNTGTIPDLDKWEATVGYGNNGYLPKGTWKIGVVANTNGYGKEPSDPAWAPAPVTIQ